MRFMLLIILGSLLYILCFSARSAEFRLGDHVKVVGGFYSHYEGVVADRQEFKDGISYQISHLQCEDIEQDDLAPKFLWINEEYLEKE